MQKQKEGEQMSVKRVRRPERNKFIAFYVSDDEKAIIVGEAMAHDLSVSDYCRKTLLRNATIKDKDDEGRRSHV